MENLSVLNRSDFLSFSLDRSNKDIEKHQIRQKEWKKLGFLSQIGQPSLVKQYKEYRT
jgi:hypothetical protein